MLLGPYDCRHQPGPWQHMFPETLKLPILTQLDIAYTTPWEAADLNRLVSSCSNLQTLSLSCSPGLQLTPLLQLTALTYLWFTGATEDSTLTSLVQLSALQDLQVLFVMDPCSLTNDTSVKSLTALTQLTRLGLSDSDGVYSTTMQQQLQQQFGREELDGPDVTCHTITDTVGTLCSGCQNHIYFLDQECAGKPCQ